MGPPAMPAELAYAHRMLGPTRTGTGDSGNFAALAAEQPAGALDQFSGLLVNQVRQVNSMQSGADGLVHQLLTGGDVNQAEVLTAVQKADLAFRMMLQVRNKLIEAYREIQQIQI